MSRYYDSEIGQFISPDTPNYLAPDTIGGVDLYAYCGNNLATFFVDTVWNNGIVPAWNWVANPDNLIWLLGGISTVVGGAITIIGAFIQLPIAVTVVGVVLAVVDIAVFIWDTIRRFSN